MHSRGMFQTTGRSLGTSHEGDDLGVQGGRRGDQPVRDRVQSPEDECPEDAAVITVLEVERDDHLDGRHQGDRDPPPLTLPSDPERRLIGTGEAVCRRPSGREGITVLACASWSSAPRGCSVAGLSSVSGATARSGPPPSSSSCWPTSSSRRGRPRPWTSRRLSPTSLSPRPQTVCCRPVQTSSFTSLRWFRARPRLTSSVAIGSTSTA